MSGTGKNRIFPVSGELTGTLKKLTAAGAQAVVRKALKDSLAKSSSQSMGRP